MQNFLLLSHYYCNYQFPLASFQLQPLSGVFPRPIPRGKFSLHKPDCFPYFPWEVIIARTFSYTFTHPPCSRHSSWAV